MGSIYQSIELLSKEKGIETQIVLDAVKHALLVVARKYYHTDEHYIAELNETTGSIDLFAVTRGPGSFTGVRIGLATMQGLALALDKPVCAMSTHEAIAPDSGRAAVVDDAGRGESYVSLFEDGREIVAPHLAKRDEVASLVGVMRVSEVMQRENVALACARRARAIVARGDGERYRDVTPIYVRLAEAEVKLQQQKQG